MPDGTELLVGFGLSLRVALRSPGERLRRHGYDDDVYLSTEQTVQIGVRGAVREAKKRVRRTDQNIEMAIQDQNVAMDALDFVL